MALLRDNAVQHRMGLLLAHYMAAVNLLGRVQVAREVYRKTGKKVGIAASSRFRSRPAHYAEDDEQADDLAAPTAAEMAMGFSVHLPAANATDYLRNLTPVTKDTFDGLSEQYKRYAFTVAGISDQRLIAKIRDELANVMQSGGTQDDFDAAVKKLNSDAGVEDLNAFTLDTVFQTNMQKAYSLGRYEQMKDPATMQALPFWQYWTMGDDHVRPEHAVIDGFVARAIDPVWNKIYPPNGFNCRCIVITLTEKEALAIDKNAGDGGLLRLPLLAQLKVPQPGFGKVF
jgi:SPP1 gp7 family putative phage head morphogenesis protein